MPEKVVNDKVVKKEESAQQGITLTPEYYTDLVTCATKMQSLINYVLRVNYVDKDVVLDILGFNKVSSQNHTEESENK